MTETGGLWLPVLPFLRAFGAERERMQVKVDEEACGCDGRATTRNPIPVCSALDRGLALAPGRRQDEAIDLENAIGRVMAEDLAVRFALPPFDNATMDGDALRITGHSPDRRPRGRVARYLLFGKYLADLQIRWVGLHSGGEARIEAGDALEVVYLWPSAQAMRAAFDKTGPRHMTIETLQFAWVREWTGAPRVALDQDVADFDGSLQGVREVAFFPPMTDG